MSDLGEVGYRAYAESTGGKTFDGRDMPAWSALPPHVVRAWNDAGKAIAKRVYEAVQASEPCPETLPAPKGYPFGDVP